MNNYQLRISDCGFRNEKTIYREGAKSAKKFFLTSDFMDQSNHLQPPIMSGIASAGCDSVIDDETAGSLPKKTSLTSRLSGSNSPVLVCILSSVICLLTSALPVYAISGRDVYEKVHEVNLKSLDHKIEMTMVLFDKGGGKRSRTLTSYSKKADPEAYKALAVFKSPPDLKNVGFLVHAHTFSNRDLWAYFPEYKRVRRIATSSQDDSFFGSDLSYDDFTGPPNLDDYKFSILKEEELDGKPCYVVEVTPKIRRKYTKYIAWVAKDLWVQLKIDYYQDKDVYRSGVFKDVRMIDQIPTPFQSKMENKRTGHRTELTLENVQYNTHFSDDLFTQRSLERAGK